MLYLPIFLFFIFDVTDSERSGRRIRDGIQLITNKTYVVYLAKGDVSKRRYDEWTCGGALVTHEFLITSAACVDDIEYAYVIAGYKKLIPYEKLETDACTKNMKKKIIYTCTPVQYRLLFNRLEKWSNVDIALAKVESPYNFDDPGYLKHCSYKPTIISINYEKKYQVAGIDAMVLGWGHLKVWRKPGDKTRYNQELLHYAPCTVADNEKCKAEYTDYTNMSEVIDKFMICTYGHGNIDENGKIIATSPPQTCHGSNTSLLRFDELSCEDEDDEIGDYTRRNMSYARQLSNESIYELSSNRTELRRRLRKESSTEENSDEHYEDHEDEKSLNLTEEMGICQNDHGGPLVTWVGAQEVLIGVASVFKVSTESECIGPYLYTSTQCNGAFLDCVLSYSDALPNKKATTTTKKPDAARYFRRSSSLCHRPAAERGYDTVEKHISWKRHPSGPADNERGETLVRSKDKENKIPNKYGKNDDKNKPKNKHFTKEIYPARKPPTESHTSYLKVTKLDRYPAFQKYDRHTAYENNAGLKNLPTNDRIPAVLGYPANLRYPENNRYTLGTRYPPNKRYPAYERYPANLGYKNTAPNPSFAAAAHINNDQLRARPMRPMRPLRS